MTDTQATIQAKAQKFESLIVQSALAKTGGDPPWVHSDIYLDVSEERGTVDVMVQAGGGSVNTYCTFRESYFEELEGEATAMLDVQATLERLGIASDGGRMSFSFVGPDEDELAERLVAEGALEMSVTLPASEKALENVPRDIPERFNEDEQFLSPSGNPHKTYVDTTVDQLATTIETVALEDTLDYFPVTVEDGEFTLNVGDDLDYLRGELQAGAVEGPDLQNWYGPGFEPAFDSTLSGDVQLQTTPGEDGGYPMAVVQEDEDKTIRHVLVEVNPA